MIVKLFHDQSPRNLRGRAWIRTCDLWACSQRRYRLHYGDWHLHFNT